jgi:hypothetical protein
VIYLIGGFGMWFVRAFLPATGVLLAGLLVVLVVAKLGRWRARPAIIVVSMMAGALITYRTYAVWDELAHPERAMFRRYIASPIPSTVRNLAPASGAPAQFHEGALVAFEAPASVVAALLTHTLPGSTARGSLAEFKVRNGRDTTSSSRVAAPDGSYLAVDTLSFPPEMVDVFRGAHTRVRDAARAGLESYLLAELGDWGRFESVVTYDRANELVRVQQYAVRAPVR